MGTPLVVQWLRLWSPNAGGSPSPTPSCNAQIWAPLWYYDAKPSAWGLRTGPTAENPISPTHILWNTHSVWGRKWKLGVCPQGACCLIGEADFSVTSCKWVLIEVKTKCTEKEKASWWRWQRASESISLQQAEAGARVAGIPGWGSTAKKKDWRLCGGRRTRWGGGGVSVQGSDHGLFKKKKKSIFLNIYFFIWLCWVLFMTQWIFNFHCGMQDL